VFERIPGAADFLSDGVALVNMEGVVLYTNVAARTLLGLEEGGQKLPLASPVRRALESVRRGLNELPKEISIRGVQHDGRPMYAEARLDQLSDEGAVVVLLRNQTQAMLYANLLKNLMDMLYGNLLLPCEALAAAVGRAESAMATGQPDVDLIKESLARAVVVKEGCEGLVDLSHLIGHFPIAGDERIPAANLFQLLVERIGQVARELGLTFQAAPAPEGLPALYGSSKWLLRALEESLVAVLGGADEARGLTANVAATPEGFLIAFRLRCRQRPAGMGEGSGEILPEAQAMLAPELAIDRHVLELHGGRARLHWNANGDCLELTFRFALKTGVREESTLGAEQAQRYAKDIAQLYRLRVQGNLKGQEP